MNEIELRGPITIADSERIMNLGHSQGWQCQSYKQITVYCDTKNVDRIGDVRNGSARLIVDIRPKHITLKIKIGNPLQTQRIEHALKFPRESLPALIALLNISGIENGYIRTFDRTDYVIAPGISLTIKLNCLMGDHFELESSVASNGIVDTLKKMTRDFGLSVWTSEELACAIESDHKKVQALPLHTILNSFAV
jgi:hypothetical protein